MSIVIEQVIGATEDGVRALVDHAGEKLTVVVATDIARAIDSVGKSLTVELGFEQVLGWRVLPEVAPVDHGLFDVLGEPGAVRVVGTVHNILALGNGALLFDVYVQAGPEFLTFQSSDLPGQPPALRDSIEATIRGLCFYPTWA
jgi:hypothetical protein